MARAGSTDEAADGPSRSGGSATRIHCPWWSVGNFWESLLESSSRHVARCLPHFLEVHVPSIVTELPAVNAFAADVIWQESPPSTSSLWCLLRMRYQDRRLCVLKRAPIGD